MHNPQGAMTPHPRSFRAAPATKQIAEVDDKQRVRLTIVLRPSTPFDPRRFGAGRGMTRDEYRSRHSTSQDVVDRVTAFVSAHGLRVESADRARHVVRLSGTYAQARDAFRPEHIGVYSANGRRYVARSGRLTF